MWWVSDALILQIWCFSLSFHFQLLSFFLFFVHYCLKFLPTIILFLHSIFLNQSCSLQYFSHFSSCCHWLFVLIWILLSSTIDKHVYFTKCFHYYQKYIFCKSLKLIPSFFCYKTLTTSHFFFYKYMNFTLVVKDLELGFCVHIVNLLSIVHILVALVVSFQMSSTFCSVCMSLCLPFVKLEFVVIFIVIIMKHVLDKACFVGTFLTNDISRLIHNTISIHNTIFTISKLIKLQIFIINFQL